MRCDRCKRKAKRWPLGRDLVRDRSPFKMFEGDGVQHCFDRLTWDNDISYTLETYETETRYSETYCTDCIIKWMRPMLFIYTVLHVSMKDYLPEEIRDSIFDYAMPRPYSRGWKETFHTKKDDFDLDFSRWKTNGFGLSHMDSNNTEDKTHYS